MAKLRTCVLGKSKDDLIKAISSQSDKYNDRLIEFMNIYEIGGLKEATVEQLGEYISMNLCKQEKERGK